MFALLWMKGSCSDCWLWRFKLEAIYTLDLNPFIIAVLKQSIKVVRFLLFDDRDIIV